MYDHIVAGQPSITHYKHVFISKIKFNLLPVDRGRNLVLVASLERVYDAEDFGGVSSRAGRVGEDCADSLLWIDHKHAADRECNSFLVHVRGILVVDPEIGLSAHGYRPTSSSSSCFVDIHVVHERNLALLVADDWEAQFAPGDLIDILDPAAMALNRVRAQSDELDIPLREFWLELGEGTEFGGADGSVIFWVREEDHPAVADELVEVDGTVGGLSVEIWSCVAQSERSCALL